MQARAVLVLLVLHVRMHVRGGQERGTRAQIDGQGQHVPKELDARLAPLQLVLGHDEPAVEAERECGRGVGGGCVCVM